MQGTHQLIPQLLVLLLESHEQLMTLCAQTNLQVSLLSLQGLDFGLQLPDRENTVHEGVIRTKTAQEDTRGRRAPAHNHEEERKNSTQQRETTEECTHNGMPAQNDMRTQKGRKAKQDMKALIQGKPKTGTKASCSSVEKCWE